jgi:hypothetical protein
MADRPEQDERIRGVEHLRDELDRLREDVEALRKEVLDRRRLPDRRKSPDQFRDRRRPGG